MLPLDVAAAVIVQLRNSTSEIVHVAHPYPVKWKTIINHVSTTLGVPLVSYSAWLRKLEHTESTNSATNNPALRLIDFYRAIDKVDVTRLEVAGAPKLATIEAREESSVLGNPEIQRVGVKDVQKWLESWRSLGLLSF